ncbi:MAG: esterase [Bacteroidia bacterium]|nr:esterase [Bacteroidia bacterium]MBT8277828.1 esterase [Bacteroidia bacterium]NNK61142.1 esterase [Flavobacteriaceae bacterium]
MKTKVNFLIAFILLLSNGVNAQTIYEEFDSYKLGENRQIKIQLPRNYEDNEDKLYPLFVVFDGDYLFEAVAGNVDYYSYWEDMPEAIIVGVNQVETRDADNLYSGQNSLPIETGAKFFEFIGMELIPYMISTYRIANFKVAVGHGETASFINYYLLKDQPIFRAYISISPFFAPDLLTYIPERLSKIQSKTFYYLAAGDNDINAVKEDAEALNTSLSGIENKNLLFNFNSFEGATHYTNPAYALPRALESIFFVFQPISRTEYKEEILTLKTSPVDYLQEKYEMIDQLFGLEKQILINDFKAISAAIEKNETFEYYEALGKLARKHYPDTILGSYYLARFYEETGEPKKAMRTYRSAYILEEIAGLTKDLMLEKADEIKADFGF